MLGKVRAAENTGENVHIRQVMIASIVATRSREAVDPSWVTAGDVGRVIADILADAATADAVTRIESRAVV